MKKKKQPGKKPTEAEFTYYDSKYVGFSFNMKDLVEEGYIYAHVQSEYEEVYVYGDPYFHEEEYKRAIDTWEASTESWNTWLQTDDGKAWLVEQAVKEAKRKSKAKE